MLKKKQEYGNESEKGTESNRNSSEGNNGVMGKNGKENGSKWNKRIVKEFEGINRGEKNEEVKTQDIVGKEARQNVRWG